MRKYIFYIIVVFSCGFVGSCSNSTQDMDTSKKDSMNSTDSQVNDKQSVVKTGEDIVTSVDGLMVRETYKEEKRIFGKYIDGSVAEIKSMINKVVPDMMSEVQRRQLILSGTLLVIYPNENPGNSKTRLFIGIPVKVRKPVPGYDFLEFPAGDYYKATVNAAPGESTTHWTTYLKQLDKLSFKYTKPYYEYYSDSRNAEMATVIAQTSLLVKKQ